LTAIADFKQLLLQSKQEIDEMQKTRKGEASIQEKLCFFKSVLKQIADILAGFEEAKKSIKMVG